MTNWIECPGDPRGQNRGRRSHPKGNADDRQVLTLQAPGWPGHLPVLSSAGVASLRSLLRNPPLRILRSLPVRFHPFASTKVCSLRYTQPASLPTTLPTPFRRTAPACLSTTPPSHHTYYIDLDPDPEFRPEPRRVQYRPDHEAQPRFYVRRSSYNVAIIMYT